MKTLTEKFYYLVDNHFISSVLIIFILSSYVVATIIIRIDSIGEIAKIEQLRNDADFINSQNSEDVIGQITQTNQRIVSIKKYNEYLIFDLIIPDSWNQVKIIEIPQN